MEIDDAGYGQAKQDKLDDDEGGDHATRPIDKQVKKRIPEDMGNIYLVAVPQQPRKVMRVKNEKMTMKMMMKVK